MYVRAFLNEYLLLDEGLERLFYFAVALGETPSFPERRVGSGVWGCGICVGSALGALSALKLDLSSVWNRMVRKCGVDGWTGLASTWVAPKAQY